MTSTGPQSAIRTNTRTGSESLFGASSPSYFKRVIAHDDFGYVLRVGLLSMLLLSELLWLTVCFDTQSISESAGEWGRAFQFAPRLSQLVIAMVAAFCLMGRTRLLTHWQEFSKQGSDRPVWSRWAIAQFVSFILFAVASEWIYEGDVLQTHIGTPAAILWILLAIATAACWMIAIAPAECLLRSLREELRFVLVGGLVGTGSLLFFQSSQSLWEPLSDVTLSLVWLMLSCCFSDVVMDSATRLIGTSVFRVEIAPQCSGYEGIGLILVFLSAFCLLFRNRLKFPNVWVLWPLGVLAIWVCNAVRIAMLIVVGSTLSPSVAMGGFHSQAGWIFFNVVALVITGTALKIPFFLNETQTPPPQSTTTATTQASPVVWYLAPFLCLMAMNLVLAAFTADFEWLYPVKVIGTFAALGLFTFPEWNRIFPKPISTRMCESSSYRFLKGTAPAILNGILVFILWIVMVGSTAGPGETSTPVALTQAPTLVAVLWLFARVIGSVIAVPIVEELAFRGYLMRRFVSERFETISYRAAPWWTVIGSSVLFGLMHQHWVAGIMAGFAYALAARRRNSLKDAIIAHAVTNGLIAAMVLTCDAWWLW